MKINVPQINFGYHPNVCLYTADQLKINKGNNYEVIALTVDPKKKKNERKQVNK